MYTYIIHTHTHTHTIYIHIHRYTVVLMKKEFVADVFHKVFQIFFNYLFLKVPLGDCFLEAKIELDIFIERCTLVEQSI